MRFNSLRFRLLASTAMLVVIILPITAFILTSYYRLAVEQAFDQRLKVHLDNLVAISLSTIEEEDGAPAIPKAIELGDPQFKRPFSGHYWQISLLGGSDDSTFISDSLLDQRIRPLPEEKAGQSDKKLKHGYIAGPEGQILRVVEQLIITGGEESEEKSDHYVFAVAFSSMELDQQVAAFRNLLMVALGVLGVGLVLAGLVQVRYGLAPLKSISRGLNEIRTGKVDRLSGEIPSEIKPLQIELNALIRSNKDIIERARTHVGNLAHALKTPLSVIANETEKARENKETMGEFANTVARQTEIMSDQVRHHLDRARMAAQVGLVGNSTRVEPVISSLVRTLQKIYRQKDIELSIECSGEIYFKGEKQDLEEMLGNLLDNAFKYASSKVDISIEITNNQFRIARFSVDDDGPGLSASKRAKAIERGQRLDENQPGSGLGLSIVAELAHLYGGGFRLETSNYGGLRAELSLPLADS